ncbi:PAS domain-containing sensor histidine kinase [Methanococcoides seepicolus]|uniref:histidine kinase n=1 Tax=Methanococcoides seepicolus TaxID=2828780 RepID=A0A9E4ZH21_9EURY|nr:PAS domain S-box protein [Methanococcoides seepicolus]MCM1987451.1 PAS domain S-box protein [Methanococcoides seepicolus]
MSDLSIEKGLLESEDIYKALFEGTAEGILVADIETKEFLFANPAMCKMLGYTEEELLQKSVLDIHQKNDLKCAISEFESQARGEKTLSSSRPCLRKNGTTLYADINTTNVLINGRGCNVGFFTDITERKKIEEELLLKNKVFESSLSANSTSKVDGIINHANAAFVEIWGYDSLEEVVGHPIPYFFVNPDDALPILESLNKTGKWEGNYLAKRKDGSTFIAQSLASVIKDEKGKLIGYHSSVIDITERKQMEEALRKSEASLANAQRISHLGNWDWDIVNNKLKFSEEIYHILGMETQEFGDTNEDFLKFVHPDDELFVQDNINKAIYEHKPYSIDYRLLLLDGSECTVHEEAEVTFNETGQAIRMFGTMQDITIRKQVEDAMFNAKLAAEAANKSKAEFIANMTHELSTPLNAVIGFSEMLLLGTFGTLNDKQTKYANNINSSGKHLLDVINDILDLSKIEAGKMELHINEFFVSDAIDEVEALMIPIASQKNIDLTCNIDIETPIIKADTIKFKQILYNLVSNAIKFTEQGGFVTIGGKISEDFVHIYVKDSGIGISPEDQDKLFTSFFQADSSSTREYGGTGLSLALIKKFVEMHGGEVWVESEVGKGSTFGFSIPTNLESTSF